MDRRTRARLLVGGVAVVAVVAVGGSAAVASNDDGDGRVTGPAADHAVAAALRATHGGTANSVERDSEDGATWEVEVTEPGGRTVDVRLDEGYRVVVIEGDREESSDHAG